MPIYQEHPCLVCGKTTTNKTYCDLHLSLIKRPFFPNRPSQRLITAERPRQFKRMEYWMMVKR